MIPLGASLRVVSHVSILPYLFAQEGAGTMMRCSTDNCGEKAVWRWYGNAESHNVIYPVGNRCMEILRDLGVKDEDFKSLPSPKEEAE